MRVGAEIYATVTLFWKIVAHLSSKLPTSLLAYPSSFIHLGLGAGSSRRRPVFKFRGDTRNFITRYASEDTWFSGFSLREGLTTVLTHFYSLDQIFLPALADHYLILKVSEDWWWFLSFSHSSWEKSEKLQGKSLSRVQCKREEARRPPTPRHSPPSSRLSRRRWFVSCSWRRDRSERINIADRRRAENREQRAVRTRVSRVYRVWFLHSSSTDSCDDMDALIFATQGLTRRGLLRDVNKHANKTAPKSLHSSCLSNKKRK